MNRTLIAILFAAGCTASVRSAPPVEPAPPPPPPPPAAAPAPAPAPMPAPSPAPPPPPPPPAPAPAPVVTAPPAHPAYMAAIQNLREARAMLERPAGAADVKWDEKVAIREIDDALHDIRAARVDDGKPDTEHAPIESKLMYRDRLKEAEKELHEAARDLEQREDNFWAKKDRKHAIESIRRAEKATHEAMADRHEDKAERKEEKREDREEKHEAHEAHEKHGH